MDDFVNNIENIPECEKLYMGHDLLPTQEQEDVLKKLKIEINIIPDYYYKDLQEK